MIEVDIIAGFLGAGKTTLINKLLGGACGTEKLALIENEFGEVGVDGALLSGTGMQIAELDSGCICCSLAGDFTEALLTLARDYAPDRILIEPSGVAALSDVLTAVKEAAEHGAELVVEHILTVADALRVSAQLASYGYGEVTEDQLKHCDAIVLSRTQGMEEEALTALCAELAELNPRASVVTTPWEELSAEELLAVTKQEHTLEDELLSELVPEHTHHRHEHGEHHDHHAHQAEGMFQSWGAETPRRFTEAALGAILGEFGTGRCGMILRAKGIVPSENGWLAFDYVPGEQKIRPAAPAATGKLCVIGVMLDEKTLTSLFLG
ncbi:MAG: GTP-binding protein [Clostridia bacterium]|nr:GTP-binding protein [Clostridia bacterium]